MSRGLGDVYKRQIHLMVKNHFFQAEDGIRDLRMSRGLGDVYKRQGLNNVTSGCLLYTSPSPRDMRRSRMPSSA
ncbi:hypothetical protein JMUB7527_28600 [Staphylococcus aureus]